MALFSIPGPAPEGSPPSPRESECRRRPGMGQARPWPIDSPFWRLASLSLLSGRDWSGVAQLTAWGGHAGPRRPSSQVIEGLLQRILPGALVPIWGMSWSCGPPASGTPSGRWLGPLGSLLTVPAWNPRGLGGGESDCGDQVSQDRTRQDSFSSCPPTLSLQRGCLLQPARW